MKKIFIYGAGEFGRSCIKHFLNLKDVLILGVIDKNREKWGKLLDGYQIVSLSQVKKTDFDQIIIAVKRYEDALIDILRYGIKIDIIDIYDADNDSILKITIRDVERIVNYERIIKQIQYGLLFECFENGDFEEANRIFVSNSEYFEFINGFFELAAPKITICQLSKADIINDDDMFIVCDNNYKNTLEMISHHGGLMTQCVVLPLYVVKNKIDMRK